MAPRFGYMGWVYHDPDAMWMLASYLMLLAIAAFLPPRPVQFSGYAAWFLYATLLVPVATVPQYGSTRAPLDSFAFAGFCAVVWIVVVLILRRRASLIVPIRTNGSALMWALVIIISAMTYVYLAVVSGISINIMSVFAIYDTRLAYRDELIPTAPLLGYLITNQGNVVNPFLMSFGAMKHRWLLVALGVVGQLVIYSTTGYKTALISIPLCLILVFLLKNRSSIIGSMIVFGIAALSWISIVIDRIASLGLVDILVTRTFLTAGYLMSLYRDAYADGVWALWDYSLLGPFVETQYTTSPGFYVGETMLGRPDVQLNASLFADGYANLGLVGIGIEAVFLVVLFLLVDSAARRVPTALVVSVGLLPVFALANASPFSAVLSFGFGLMVLLFALYPRDQSGYKDALWRGDSAEKTTMRRPPVRPIKSLK